MSKTYKLTMTHQFYIETNDIREVLNNYQFPDFSDCESIVGEPEYLTGGNEWQEMSETELELLFS
jgi:hypothetical protein